MVYGPYDTSLPAGPNTANFSLKVDNNTADNNAICNIDVNDATTNTILATQTITRSGSGPCARRRRGKATDW